MSQTKIAAAKGLRAQEAMLMETTILLTADGLIASPKTQEGDWREEEIKDICQQLAEAHEEYKKLNASVKGEICALAQENSQDPSQLLRDDSNPQKDFILHYRTVHSKLKQALKRIQKENTQEMARQEVERKRAQEDEDRELARRKADEDRELARRKADRDEERAQRTAEQELQQSKDEAQLFRDKAKQELQRSKDEAQLFRDKAKQELQRSKDEAQLFRDKAEQELQLYEAESAQKRAEFEMQLAQDEAEFEKELAQKWVEHEKELARQRADAQERLKQIEAAHREEQRRKKECQEKKDEQVLSQSQHSSSTKNHPSNSSEAMAVEATPSTPSFTVTTSADGTLERSSMETLLVNCMTDKKGSEHIIACEREGQTELLCPATSENQGIEHPEPSQLTPKLAPKTSDQLDTSLATDVPHLDGATPFNQDAKTAEVR